MSLNPNAPSFTLSASAREWKPSWSQTTTTPNTSISTPSPAPIVASSTTQVEVKPPTPPIIEKEIKKEEENEQGEGEDEDVDETDPLWIATLKLTNGDRREALKLLEDPDSLMQYPEIAKLITEGGDDKEDDDGDNNNNDNNESKEPSSEVTTTTSADDWEKTSDNVQKESSSLSTSEVTSKPSKSVPPSSSSSIVTSTEDGEDTALEPEVEIDGDPRDHMNLVFIGHVDAGKSTLSGSILYLMGKVDARTIERFEREAKQRNRESWFLAFIMDTSEEERAKGKTVEVGRASFETPVHRYTILDAPGHKNYVPNMISGATQADIGVLVISARRGEFETGFEKGGQTREHALLAKTLGVRFLVVVINKMDDSTVNWEQERFDECVNKLKPFLKTCGYAIKRDVRFIPISGLNGANILNEVSPTVCPWWRELCAAGANNTTIPTLIGTLDAFTIADRNPDGPLRIPVLDRYIERGLVVMGKVESGTLRVRDEVAILPTRRKAIVEGIYSGDVKLRYALPGENVLIKFSLNLEDVQKGYVLSSLQKSCPAVREFVIQLALVDMVEHRPVFTSGYDCVMHLHTAEIEVTCVQLLSVTDKKGVETQRRFAKQGEMCTAKFVTPLTVCMETFANMPALGRITLRDEGKTIAIGKIIKLYKPKPT